MDLGGHRWRRTAHAVAPRATRSRTRSRHRRVPAPAPASGRGVRCHGSVPTMLLDQPGGDTIARVHAGSTVEVLAREGDWSRVRIEGWTCSGALAGAGGGSGSILADVSRDSLEAYPDRPPRTAGGVVRPVHRPPDRRSGSARTSCWASRSCSHAARVTTRASSTWPWAGPPGGGRAADAPAADPDRGPDPDGPILPHRGARRGSAGDHRPLTSAGTPACLVAEGRLHRYALDGHGERNAQQPEGGCGGVHRPDPFQRDAATHGLPPGDPGDDHVGRLVAAVGATVAAVVRRDDDGVVPRP
jgi:hypothetical protein